jgi:hypothetical protein
VPKIAAHDFGFLFRFLFLFRSRFARLLGEEIRIPRTDVNKKSKKIFSPRRAIFLYTGSKSAEAHES